jgi:hypothetical protein
MLAGPNPKKSKLNEVSNDSQMEEEKESAADL